MPGQRRPVGLLAVHAHPDDETLSTGALLATWAAAGRPVTVVTCTRGEQGEVIPADLAHLEGDGPALAAHREGELAAALASLGVDDHVFLDRVVLPDDDGGPVRYADSGMAWLGAGRAGAAGQVPPGAFVAVDVDEAAGRLAQVLRDRRPGVVVGYEPGGGYGHPDHVQAHRVMHRAVELAAGQDAAGGAAWRVPVVLWSVLDAGAVRAARLALRDEREDERQDGEPSAGAASTDGPLELPDPDGDLPSAAVDRASIDLRVDVAPVLTQVLAALRAHRSQVQGVRASGAAPGRYALSNRVLTPLLADECYRFAAAPGPGRPHWPAGVVPVGADPSAQVT